MYGADLWYYPDYCLCDYCFEKFLAEQPTNTAIPISQRQKYLVRSGQVAAYRQFIADYLEQLAKLTRQMCESIAPGFKIGALRLDVDATYTNALARGLGSESQPVLAFTEATYSTGYSSYIPNVRKRFHDSQINAVLVVGIWQNKYPPENLPEQYYYCAKDSAGYWIYSMQSLSENTRRSLPFANQQYWQAINRANEELDKLSADPKYKSSLKLRSFTAPTQQLTSEQLTVESLESVLSGLPISSSVEPIMLRYLNKLVFLARKGDKLEFEIGFNKKRGNNVSFAQVTLVSQTTDVLATSKALLGANAKLEAYALYSGTYAIVIQSYGNSAKVVSFSHPYCIDAAKLAHFLKPRGSLYLYKPAGVSSATVELFVDGVGESITAAFINPKGEVLAVYDIAGRQVVTVPLGKSLQDEIIELKIQPRPGTHFEDVRIKIKKGFEKYISPFKNMALKRKN